MVMTLTDRVVVSLHTAVALYAALLGGPMGCQSLPEKHLKSHKYYFEM